MLFTESIDVNVTPDKRQIMVQQEKVLLDLVKVLLLFVLIILEQIKESLIKLYTPMQGQLGTCRKFTSIFYLFIFNILQFIDPSSQSSNRKVSNGASHKRYLITLPVNFYIVIDLFHSPLLALMSPSKNVIANKIHQRIY